MVEHLLDQRRISAAQAAAWRPWPLWLTAASGVSVAALCFVALQEKDTIRLRREAKANGGFYVEPEAKLAFVVRIRGLNKIHPKVRRRCCCCCCCWSSCMCM